MTAWLPGPSACVALPLFAFVSLLVACAPSTSPRSAGPQPAPASASASLPPTERMQAEHRAAVAAMGGKAYLRWSTPHTMRSTVQTPSGRFVVRTDLRDDGRIITLGFGPVWAGAELSADKSLDAMFERVEKRPGSEGTQSSRTRRRLAP